MIRVVDDGTIRGSNVQNNFQDKYEWRLEQRRVLWCEDDDIDPVTVHVFSFAQPQARKCRNHLVCTTTQVFPLPAPLSLDLVEAHRPDFASFDPHHTF